MCYSDGVFKLFHDWSKWETQKEKIFKKSQPWNEGGKEQGWQHRGWIIIQTRMCHHCGLQQTKKEQVEI